MVNTKKREKVNKYDYIKNYVNGKVIKYINAGPNAKQAIYNNICNAFRRNNIKYYDYENSKITEIIIYIIINNNLSYEDQSSLFPEIDKLINSEIAKIDKKEDKIKFNNELAKTFNMKLFNAYRSIITKYEIYFANIDYCYFNNALYHFYKGNLFYNEREKWVNLIDSKKFKGYYYNSVKNDVNYIDKTHGIDIGNQRFRILFEKIDNIKNNIDTTGIIICSILILFILGVGILCANLYIEHIYRMEKILNMIMENQNNINNSLNNYINSKKYLNLF